MIAGRVHLIGAGPGAADLLTLRAAKLLAEAEIVLHDALVEPEVLALAPQARLVSVGKRAGRASVDQAVINRLVVRFGRKHRVVRLKGGDPMLFGRAQEEIDACRAAGVPVEVVPGVSAAFAASAELLASLTQRAIARSVAFVTPAAGRGLAADEHWADAAASADSAAIYMGKADAVRIRAALLARGLRAGRPAVIVENASRADQRVVAGSVGTLPDLAAQLGDGPALVLIGEAFARVAAQYAAQPETRAQTA